MRCVGIEQLLDVAQGRAEAAVAEQIQAHLASGCARCQSNWDWLQKLVRLTATDNLVEPPRWVVQRAVRLFQEQGPQRKPRLLERIVATLAYDSMAQKQPVGVRQTGRATRQYVYRAGDWDVDVLVEVGDEPEILDMTGQVLKREGTGGEVAGIPVHLVQGEKIMGSTVTDRLGEFTFDHVAGGIYDLSIELRHQEVWIKHIAVTLSE